jgi:hypothetical protein
MKYYKNHQILIKLNNLSSNILSLIEKINYINVYYILFE